MDDFISVYTPWLIASGITWVLFAAFLGWGFITDKTVNSDWDKLRPGLKLGCLFIITLVPSVLCLIIGLFFAVPKYRQAKHNPTSTPTPIPIIEFPGRLVTDSLTEIYPGSIELMFVEHQLPATSGFIDFMRSPNGNYLLTRDRTTGFLINLHTWEAKKTKIPVNEGSSFSPDDKYLATSENGNIYLEELKTELVFEPITPRCKSYGIGNAGFANICLFVGRPIWVDIDKFAFLHEIGIFDEKAFTFPDEVSLPLNGGKITLGTSNSLTIMDIEGQVMLRNISPFDTQQTEQGDFYTLDTARLADGFYTVKAGKFSSNPFDKVARWYGSRPNDPIYDQLLNFPSNGLLSPSKEFLLIPPNITLEIDTGKISVLYEPNKFPNEKFYTSCVWHPSGEHIACSSFQKRTETKNDYFIEIYSFKSNSLKVYETNLPFMLITWLE